MSRTERAWAAGFFDGEGWIGSARYSLKTGGMTATITLAVSQNEPALLQRFQVAVGGVGRVLGPRKVRTSLMWTYKVHSLAKVEVVVKALWPWLGSKKRTQVTAALTDARRYRRTHPAKVLSMSQAAEIRKRFANGERQVELAVAFGVRRSVIWKVVRGRTYTPQEIRQVAD